MNYVLLHLLKRYSICSVETMQRKNSNIIFKYILYLLKWYSKCPITYEVIMYLLVGTQADTNDDADYDRRWHNGAGNGVQTNLLSERPDETRL